ncbi:uncharacterized protein LOC143597875 [Bidens hawaiensis]|uniref:uncharacterized protein LOC143597875 n=1 Tax=Bidens hawaiensis TaxID=980011 RepID=UPI0040493697
MKPHSKQVLIGKFFKRKFQEFDDNDGSPNVGKNVQEQDDDDNIVPNIPSTSSPSIPHTIDLNDLHSNPFDRPPISSYHPNQRDDIRRHYLVKKAFQPRNHNFPCNDYYGKPRRFNVAWFDKYPWLEYSIKVDKAYCLCCYLFKETVGNQSGRDTFSTEGFCNWSKPGLFLATLKLISENNPDISKYTLGNAKKNNKLTSPSIQKEIIEWFAKEVTKMICEEIKDNVFGLLVDESSNVSLKEQMAVVVRYVDKLGVFKETFIGIAHVKDTSSSTLKQAIVSLLVRGQGYDGASNIRGEFNGLKALILKDNPSAEYIHCFVHQLQLVIVGVAKKHTGVKTFYEYLSMIVNTVSASCKRKDMIREAKKKE